MIDIEKFLQPIKNKLFTMVGRGIVKLINASGKAQTLQISGLKDELVSDVERLQEYGFESFPNVDDGTPEAVMLNINGNRDQMVAIKVHDRTLRPTDLEKGDVRMYDSHGNAVKFNKDGAEVECLNGNIIKLISSGVEIECLNGNTFSMQSGKIQMNGTNLEVLS